MSTSEKKWRKVYIGLMIFIYAVYVPVSVVEWLFSEGGVPFTAVLIAILLPIMRKNHLTQLENERKK
ncbi:hypothetical protein JTF06_07500 [Desemzia sp. RIT804]|uniref:hypothetical protein n=1 Tax=Desemzia sp. RIT 804 TaxID=2810209 RepID=UPI00194EF7D4|nr:hypothetical protein [Desemzia sp. RIT 804]MBM6614734.1 hypothetical protein [Desemzia sp. RIT 804]